MSWAGMPKTTVHKDCQAALRKHEVGVPEHADMPTPSGYPVTAEKRYHFKLGGFISAASNMRHDL